MGILFLLCDALFNFKVKIVYWLEPDVSTYCSKSRLRFGKLDSNLLSTEKKGLHKELKNLEIQE